jgi:predicted enzyme related to lactoylglutathione lyase
MAEGIKRLIFPVKDLAQAKTLFTTLLGAEPYVDQPYYVGYKAGDQELGLDPHGHNKGLTGPVGYWTVSDIRASVESLVGAGAKVQQAVQDVGGGMLIATLKDADGNDFGLVQEA